MATQRELMRQKRNDSLDSGMHCWRKATEDNDIGGGGMKRLESRKGVR